MKTTTVKDAFFIATAPYNREIVIISDVGEFGCLKVLANSSKYFNGYYPDFKYFNGKSLKTVTKSSLKSFFTKALKQDPTYFSINELEKLGDYFKIKIEKHLSEQLKFKFEKQRQRGWHKDHYNFNKAEKWEREPAKRKTPARNVVKKKATTKRKTTKR